MRLLDVALEFSEAVAVPVQVDVVVVAVAVAGTDHLVHPVEALAGARARRDRGERLLDRERVDVLLVPGGGLAGRDAIHVGLVQGEDGCERAVVNDDIQERKEMMSDLLAQPCCF